MAKVTSKYQATVPKAIADQYGLRAGDEIDWVPADDAIRVIPSWRRPGALDRETRLRLFDQATARLRRRAPRKGAGNRDWTREDLYTRGRFR